MKAYLDNAATTQVDPEIVASMAKFHLEEFGNPSSVHPLGIRARKALEEARQSLASQLGAESGKLIFTSGGTEANNLALLGFIGNLSKYGRHILLGALEHPCVLETGKKLREQGYQVETTQVNARGKIDVEDFQAKLRSETVLIAIMQANNEVGSIAPIQQLANLARQHAAHAHFHVDAVQSFGKIPVSLRELQVDSLAISSHKIHGPKGVGALAYTGNRQPQPLLFGGGQEHGLRSGTENVPGIIGLVQAAKKIVRHDKDAQRMRELRAQLAQCITKIPQTFIHGDPEFHLPNILSAAFLDCPAEVLLHHLEAQGIYVSAGSACHSKKGAGSHVLHAMGLPEAQIESTLRFSLSRLTTEKEIQYTIDVLPKLVENLRKVGL